MKLAAGELSDFPAAQAHQLEPWSMFLTQLAAIALRCSGRRDLGLSESDWCSAILGLTNGSHEPWCLVVEDLSKAAFFQPPVPEGTVEKWKQADHPDDIDVLVTAKGHDVKPSRISAADVEAWCFALMTLQTMQGYSGGAGGYNGIARMKGGYGSRPRVGNAPDLTLASRFSRDVNVLLESWQTVADRCGLSEAGVSVVWTLPWDGISSLERGQLSPCFIEICRRVRLMASPLGLRCHYTTSKGRRCVALDKTGDVGDPWIPIERSDRGALTIGERGFHYALLTRVLLEQDFEPAATQVIQPGDTDPLLILASVMARGQGKTEGLHTRTLPIPTQVRRRLGRPQTRAALGVRARSNVQDADRMRKNVLFPALKQLALGEKTVPDNFDQRVNDIFFDELFGTIDSGNEQAQRDWQCRLHELARAELQRVIDRCCLPSGRWYHSVSNAEGMFSGCLTRHFPTLAESIIGGQRSDGDLYDR